MRATIEYVCDWCSESGDDQNGHIKITTPTGVIEGTWDCRGGMGGGTELVSNTTEEYTDEEAERLLDSSDLCQGNGVYDADIVTDEYGWYTLENVSDVRLVDDDDAPQQPITLTHSDEASGVTILEDGTMCLWSEGPGTYVKVYRALQDPFVVEDATDAICVRCDDGISRGLHPVRRMTQMEERMYNTLRNCRVV